MITKILEPLVAERFRTDDEYRKGHIRIINALPQVRIMGLHAPEMKAVAKELAAREDALELAGRFAAEAARQTEDGMQVLRYEEKVIWGLMLNAMKLPTEERFRLLVEFVPHIDNWAVCDTFCCSAKWVDVPESVVVKPVSGGKSGFIRKRTFWKCSQEELWAFLQPYFRSDMEFEVRFAVVMSMCSLMDEVWLPEIFRQFDSLNFSRIHSDYISRHQAIQSGIADGDGLQKGIVLGEPPFYVRMAVAWFLATALAKFPERTRAYMAVSSLPEDVRRLYVRKAKESFRTREVSPF